MTAVDISETAINQAKKNAELNGLNINFVVDDVFEYLDKVNKKEYDLIILDPPRDGINPKALQKILGYGVPYMIYVSCKPTSLARDLEILQGSGYVMTRAVAVDQFPWTNHVETVVLLTKTSVSEG